MKVDGGPIFKLGSTVPVRFRLTGASAGITHLLARRYPVHCNRQGHG